MAILSLTETERRALQDTVKRTRAARVMQRAQALLWLDQGESAAAVAQRLAVTRQTIYSWVHRFQLRSTTQVPDRLRDQDRSRRPPSKRAAITALIKRLWQPPSTSGLPTSSDVPRTAPALQRRLKQEGLVVHERTIRRTLRHLNYRYKRPRYVLARRSKTWRQQKGGSSAI
jgi:transposase